MATTKEIWQRICNRQVKNSDSKDSSLMGGSSKSEYVTAPATQSEQATTSSSPFLSACSHLESLMERTDNEKIRSVVEEQIEHSKRHWSQGVDYSDSDEEEEEAEISNVKVFKSLQMHPTWGCFFRTICECEMVMGEKFAEGGQAELYEAQVIRHKNSQFYVDHFVNPSEWGPDYPPDFALKVFKKGTFVRHLQF